MSRFVLKTHERLTGRHILARLEEMNRNQWLSHDELLALQSAKLQRLVEYAYQFVPYYQRIFDEVGVKPDDIKRDLSCLNKIPILTKAIIRENWDDLLTTETERRRRMSKLATSGSTGEPLIFMQDSNFRDYATADLQYHMGWAGWQLGDIHAMIWGVHPNLALSRMVRTALVDQVWNRIKINAFALTDTSMAAFTKRIHRQKPNILYGYATSVYQFAQFIRHNPYPDITFDAVFTTSELLIPPVRQFIEETFRCKAFDRYGALELGGIACECKAHTGLHISMENNYVEILCDGLPANSGEVGDIIVTNLNNLGMPFIRYSIGDAGAWYNAENCPCGRASLMLEMIEGRLVDSFQTFDGRRVWSGFAGAAFRCLAHPAIKQFQVVQKALDRFVIRLVPDGEIPQSALEDIRQAVRATFGEPVKVEFEFLQKIPPLPSGKHQYAISELNKPGSTKGVH